MLLIKLSVVVIEEIFLNGIFKPITAKLSNFSPQDERLQNSA